EVVNRGTTDARGLPDEGVLGEIAGPRRLGAIAGAETEDARRRIVRLILVVRPLPLDVGPCRPGFQQEHVEPLRGELLCDDGAAGARADDDHVMHYQYP